MESRLKSWPGHVGQLTDGSWVTKCDPLSAMLCIVTRLQVGQYRCISPLYSVDCDHEELTSLFLLLYRSLRRWQWSNGNLPDCVIRRQFRLPRTTHPNCSACVTLPPFVM